MSIDKCVAEKHALLVEHEEALACENHATHTIGVGRDCLTVELADVLVSTRGKCVTLILVNTKVELGTMLNHRLVER